MEVVVAIFESVVSGIEIAISITTIINELKSTPSIIETVNGQVDQIAYRLKHLQRESKIRFLDAELMKTWLVYQKTCNTNLRRVHEILCHYSKRSRSKLAVLGSAKFQYFGGKEELDAVSQSMQRCNDCLGWLSENILKAPLIDDVMNGGADAQRIEQPILSLSQYVRFMLKDDALKEV